MPDEVLPVAAHFYLAPKYHPDKGIILGSETGTCLTLPSEYADFRKTARLHEVPMEKLFLRETSVLDIAKQDGQEITETEVKQAIEKTRFSNGNALLLRTGWGDRGIQCEPGSRYILASPHLSVEAAELLASFMVRARKRSLAHGHGVDRTARQASHPRVVLSFPAPRPLAVNGGADLSPPLYTRESQRRFRR